MTEAIQKLQTEVKAIKKEVAFLRRVIRENYALSSETKCMLHEARKTPESEYVTL